MTTQASDNWAVGDAYERYVGRWSRLVSEKLLEWLRPSPELDWLDVGCGTGALTRTLLERAQPHAVTGIDPSAGFIEHAQRRITDPRVTWCVGDAQRLLRFSRSLASSLAFVAMFAGASQASAQDRLCDPGEEDCRAILLNYIRTETVGIDVGFWFMEAARYPTELIRRFKAGVPVRSTCGRPFGEAQSRSTSVPSLRAHARLAGSRPAMATRRTDGGHSPSRGGYITSTAHQSASLGTAASATFWSSAS
jgi:SAM-dependent methyltransferase